ncbi:uncharacterized protein LOC131053609 [Cryptomeria japonica]|uniref:uncharacterized protein LOC131053609 n=1 Tax=Cryptomeria japonica TaxID=3369 RepID=UPI0027D9E7D7|nr:uncharacterized protein LOC131053609 [Cryptomeria japonica]
MASLVEKTASTDTKKSQEAGSISSVPGVTHAIPLSIIAPLQELQNAPAVGLNPEPTPAQVEETEASASPKKAKRKRGENRVTIVVSREETKEEALTPEARKPTPKKRKSNKDYAKEKPAQLTPPVIENEEVTKKKTKETSKKNIQRRETLAKRRLFAPIAEETPQP